MPLHETRAYILPPWLSIDSVACRSFEFSFFSVLFYLRPSPQDDCISFDFFLMCRHKKSRGTLFLIVFWGLRLPNYQTRKAHDFTRERPWLIFFGSFSWKCRSFRKPIISKNAFICLIKCTNSNAVSFCFLSSFLFVGFQLAKIWIFTSIVQILFDSLEKSHSASNK